MSDIKVIVEISSREETDDVFLKVRFDPDLTRTDVEQLGYYPASYLVLDKYIMPAIEKAFGDAEETEFVEMAPANTRLN